MIQPEHPPDASLALNRPPHLTVPQAMPYPRLHRDWGFLHYPADVASHDYTRILGIDYPLSVLDNFADDPTPDAELLDDAEGLIIRLLRKTPADRRMEYRYHLEVAARNAVRSGSPNAADLLAEHIHWVERDLNEMDAKLGPPHGLPFTINVLRSQPEACWEWQDGLDRGRKYPTTASWRGMQHITVHRLLWPIMWPDEPFRARPARYQCDNDVCVNPRHFIDPLKRAKRENQGPGKGRPYPDGDYRTANSIPYYIEHVEALGEGKFLLRCPRCHTPASDYYQELVNRSIAQGWRGDYRGKMGTFHCIPCDKLFKAQRDARRPVPRRANPRGLTEAERFDQKFTAPMQDLDDGWGHASGWRTDPALLEDADEDEQKSLPSGFSQGWPEGYDPDKEVEELRRQGKL